MKSPLTNFVAFITLLAGLTFMATPALAGPDFFQQQLNQKLIKSQQQLQAAAKAKEADRERLMAEHMHTMHEVMQQFKSMKPKDSMSMEEHQAWIDEHLKLMDTVMAQLMEEHHLLMSGTEPHQH